MARRELKKNQGGPNRGNPNSTSLGGKEGKERTEKKKKKLPSRGALLRGGGGGKDGAEKRRNDKKKRKKDGCANAISGKEGWEFNTASAQVIDINKETNRKMKFIARGGDAERKGR